jgi:hypothetical protein
MYEDFEGDVVDPKAFQLGPADAAREFFRARLQSDVQRGQARTPQFRGLLRISRESGISIVELQRVTGAARQTVYDAIKAPIESALDELCVLALIASGGAQTMDAVVHCTGATHERVRRTLSSLNGAGYLEDLRSHALNSQPLGVFGVSAKGLERLQIEVDNDRLRSSYNDAWTIFIAVPDGTQRELLAAARELFGDNDSYGLVGAHVSPSTMQGPELAVVVRSPDLREALLMVRDIWQELRSRSIKRLPATPRITSSSAPTLGGDDRSGGPASSKR